jgi:CheY-like chemotaxis protein
MRRSLMQHRHDEREPPAAWPERAGRARVLIEDSDGGTSAAARQILQKAGYDVAVCCGPEYLSDRRCPLVADGTCAAAAGADVILCSLRLGMPENAAVVRALRAQHPSTPIVISVTEPRPDSRPSCSRAAGSSPSP